MVQSPWVNGPVTFGLNYDNSLREDTIQNGLGSRRAAFDSQSQLLVVNEMTPKLAVNVSHSQDCQLLRGFDYPS